MKAILNRGVRNVILTITIQWVKVAFKLIKSEPCEGLMGPEANIKMGPLYKNFFIIVQYIFEKKN